MYLGKVLDNKSKTVKNKLFTGVLVKMEKGKYPLPNKSYFFNKPKDHQKTFKTCFTSARDYKYVDRKPFYFVDKGEEKEGELGEKEGDSVIELISSPPTMANDVNNIKKLKGKERLFPHSSPISRRKKVENHSTDYDDYDDYVYDNDNYNYNYNYNYNNDNYNNDNNKNKNKKKTIASNYLQKDTSSSPLIITSSDSTELKFSKKYKDKGKYKEKEIANSNHYFGMAEKQSFNNNDLGNVNNDDLGNDLGNGNGIGKGGLCYGKASYFGASNIGSSSSFSTSKSKGENTNNHNVKSESGSRKIHENNRSSKIHYKGSSASSDYIGSSASYDYIGSCASNTSKVQPITVTPSSSSGKIESPKRPRLSRKKSIIVISSDDPPDNTMMMNMAISRNKLDFSNSDLINNDNESTNIVEVEEDNDLNDDVNVDDVNDVNVNDDDVNVLEEEEIESVESIGKEVYDVDNDDDEDDNNFVIALDDNVDDPQMMDDEALAHYLQMREFEPYQSISNFLPISNASSSSASNNLSLAASMSHSPSTNTITNNNRSSSNTANSIDFGFNNGASSSIRNLTSNSIVRNNARGNRRNIYRNQPNANRPNRSNSGGINNHRINHHQHNHHHLHHPTGLIYEEDIDFSYEGLLSLAERVGEVKSKGASSNTIDRIPSISYNESKPNQEKQCSICLIDFEKSDSLKLLPCSHSFHNDCLIQWLKLNASCPVCREKISHS